MSKYEDSHYQENSQNLNNGWLIVDKPSGMSSACAVSKVKKIFQVKKAGHAGTLDPLATGVLPIAIGEATKTVSYLVDSLKSYTFTIRWGEHTTTGDAEGDIIKTTKQRPLKQEILNLLNEFIGAISQRPPLFSSIKINGKRAYEFARLKKNISLPKRQIKIKKFKLIKLIDINHASFFVECGKGTYIRSLVEDFSQRLKTFGFVKDLRRTQVGPFSEKSSIKLGNLDSLADVKRSLYPAHKALDHLPSINLTKSQAEYFISGRCLEIEVMNKQLNFNISSNILNNRNFISSTFYNNRLIALVRKSNDKLYPIRVFNLES